MTFASVAFLAFFAVVLGVLAFVRTARTKRVVVLAASYVFYAWWDWRFAFLLAALTVVAWAGARWVDSAHSRARARRVGAVVAANVAVLGAFKYTGFFLSSAAGLLASIGVRVPALDIVVPLGLSFIVFQAISYVVDVHRRDIEPAPLWDVAVLIAFFPHVVAGPILQPRTFLPQLKNAGRVSGEELELGVQQFGLGLVKKILVADRLAMFVDPVLNHPATFSAGTLRLAALAFAIQLYMDFAGYSDMAIGAARCMGFAVPANFALPYTSRDITEFWRRWHISLSTWLRTYLYIPLGGNRKGKARQALNLVIVMLLGGLWHGASWNFVLWGGLHGIALAVHKVWSDHNPERSVSRGAQWLGALAGWTATFGFIVLAWLFFRITDLKVAAETTGRILGLGSQGGVAWISVWALVLVPAVLLLDLAARSLRLRLPQIRTFSFSGGFIVASLAIAFALFWPAAAGPFIYARF